MGADHDLASAPAGRALSSVFAMGQRALWIIGLTACSMLMYEILLTRICSLRAFFHFSFLVISNSLQLRPPQLTSALRRARARARAEARKGKGRSSRRV